MIVFSWSFLFFSDEDIILEEDSEHTYYQQSNKDPQDFNQTDLPQTPSKSSTESSPEGDPGKVIQIKMIKERNIFSPAKCNIF